MCTIYKHLTGNIGGKTAREPSNLAPLLDIQCLLDIRGRVIKNTSPNFTLSLYASAADATTAIKQKKRDYDYPDDVAIVKKLTETVIHGIYRTFLSIFLSRFSVLIKIICR